MNFDPDALLFQFLIHSLFESYILGLSKKGTVPVKALVVRRQWTYQVEVMLVWGGDEKAIPLYW